MSGNVPLDLIARYLSNDATVEEQERLLAWVADSVENQKLFHQYAAAWNSETLKVDSVNTERALQKLNSRIDWVQPVLWGRSWFKVAAVLTFFLAIGIGLWVNSNVDSSQSIAYKKVETGAGERIAVRLPDGSSVRLNSKSKLTYPEQFKGNSREVILEGEGFFDVYHDTTKPFTVRTGSVTTWVLGTSFNIQADSLTVDVTVATGKVKVSNGETVQFLNPKDKVTYDRSDQHFIRSRVDLLLDIAWVNNTIVFDDTDLVSAMKVLEDWYNVSIDIQSDSVKRCTITGTYKDETLAHVLDAIKFSTGINVTSQGRNFWIDGDGCDVTP